MSEDYYKLFNVFFDCGHMTSTYKAVFLYALCDIENYNQRSLVGKEWLDITDDYIIIKLDFIIIRMLKYYWEIAKFKIRHMPEKMSSVLVPDEDIKIVEEIKNEMIITKQIPSLSILANDSNIEFRKKVIDSSLKEVLQKILIDFPNLYKRIPIRKIKCERLLIEFFKLYGDEIRNQLQKKIKDHLECNNSDKCFNEQLNNNDNPFYLYINSNSSSEIEVNSHFEIKANEHEIFDQILKENNKQLKIKNIEWNELKKYLNYLQNINYTNDKNKSALRHKVLNDLIGNSEFLKTYTGLSYDKFEYTYKKFIKKLKLDPNVPQLLGINITQGNVCKLEPRHILLLILIRQHTDIPQKILSQIFMVNQATISRQIKYGFKIFSGIISDSNKGTTVINDTKTPSIHMNTEEQKKMRSYKTENICININKLTSKIIQIIKSNPDGIYKSDIAKALKIPPKTLELIEPKIIKINGIVKKEISYENSVLDTLFEYKISTNDSNTKIKNPNNILENYIEVNEHINNLYIQFKEKILQICPNIETVLLKNSINFEIYNEVIAKLSFRKSKIICTFKRHVAELNDHEHLLQDISRINYASNEKTSIDVYNEKTLEYCIQITEQCYILQTDF